MRRETIYMSNNGGLNLGNGVKMKRIGEKFWKRLQTDQGMNQTWG